MLSIELLTLSFVAIVNSVVLWLVATHGLRERENRFFVAAIACVIIWAVGTLFLLAGKNIYLVYLGELLFLIAPMALILFLSIFAANFLNVNYKSFNPANLALLVVTALLSIAALYDATIFIHPVMHATGFNMIEVNFVGYLIYTLYFVAAFSVTFSELLLRSRQYQSYHRRQFELIFAGTFLAAALSLATNLIMPLIGVGEYIWLGPTWTLLYVITVSVSIVKYRLFDIKVAAVRSIAYICVLATLALIYYGLVYGLSILLLGERAAGDVNLGATNIAAALLMAFLFQPVKRFFDRLTNNIFYRDNYDAETLYADMSRLLASTTDLRGLLERASTKLVTTMKAEQGMFFIYHSEDTNHYVSAGSQGRIHLALADAHALNRYVEVRGDGVIVAEVLERENPIHRLMASYRLAVILPLKRAGAIVGYLCLGEHRGGGYTTKDIRVLETLSDELVVAIQNALAVQEIKEMNATLEQKIDVATKELRSSNAQLRHIDEVKDEFMSMASHQLRTPLTSVKGYLSMVLEGDAGKINPQQKQLLEEAFNSSERMVRLISDFLNVSRLQTGKFIIEKAPVDLAKIAAQEVASLQVLASGHGLKVEFQQPKGECMVNADEGKIRQVIMNFIDNAIYYSRPDTTIKVTLEQVGSTYEVVVIDTGIGVPKAEQARLFQKFFRATNARSQRPDGTGVGLFLAKKVITAHSGKLIFSSIEGEGSHFGFSLPMLRDKAEK